ncbi:hypothetical protein B9Z55_005601 [Caenorhabditis nigoni]|uniref:DUF7778 domain-containing protein n=1 Tax=Caenorhabditis nigoni TaxID=1611254 RepID=A0A2G5V1I6_9PELO|nr:hypothetical protein B9Z55_005601 [Caenorhabditis nigoni]
MSTSLCTERKEPLSESVTKVQQLPNICAWNDSNTILRDFVMIFFTKRSAVFRMKQNLPGRKRVLILTPDDILLVYETNCTGYSFDITKAIKMKTSYFKQEKEQNMEKSCRITLKYGFGFVNFLFVTDALKNQIPIWRKTISAIFEDDSFNGNLLNDLSSYTAKDSDIDQELLTNRSTIISLKSARGSMNLFPLHDVTVDSTQIENSSLKTNSNRSSTCLPLTIRTSISNASDLSTCRYSNPMETTVVENNQKNMISIRQGSQAVSYLAKKFEAKFSSKPDNPRAPSSPLEILFPEHPVVQKPIEDPFEIRKEETPRRMSVIGSLFSKRTAKSTVEAKTEIVNE